MKEDLHELLTPEVVEGMDRVSSRELKGTVVYILASVVAGLVINYLLS